MLFMRFVLGLLFLSAVLFTAPTGRCAAQFDSPEFNASLDARAKQYQESLRQRIQHLSPALQSKIWAQVRETVKMKRELLRRGRLRLECALPCWTFHQRIALFIKRHVPQPDPSHRRSTIWGIHSASACVVNTFFSLIKTMLDRASNAVSPKISIGLRNLNSYIFCSSFLRLVHTVILRL